MRENPNVGFGRERKRRERNARVGQVTRRRSLAAFRSAVQVQSCLPFPLLGTPSLSPATSLNSRHEFVPPLWCVPLAIGLDLPANIHSVRFPGDLSHLASIIILLQKIQSTKSCRGKCYFWLYMALVGSEELEAKWMVSGHGQVGTSRLP